MNCYACDTELVGDDWDGQPATYQFDNALWLSLFGGYGMFCDNLAAKMPTNTEDRWRRDADGEYITWTDDTGQERVIDDPNWVPEYSEERVLPGQPDYEAVICHDCAHHLCATIPWIERLINSHNSHSHKTAYHVTHPDHYGWDYGSDPT